MPKMIGFAPSSKLLQRKWEEENMKRHQLKKKAMKAALDNKNPKKYSHLKLKLKTIQIEEERQSKVDIENQLLLQKMNYIMRKPGGLDNWNWNYQSKSLNYGVREKMQRDIVTENMRMANSLEGISSKYDTHKWEDDYNQYEYLKSMWNRSTKDFGLQPSRLGYKTSMDDYSSDEEHTEKLPDIEVRKKRGDRRQSETQVPTLPKIVNEKKLTDSPIDMDAKEMFKACKRLGKPEDIISKILIRKSHGHRLLVKQRFQELFDLDMETELNAALGPAYHPIITVLLADRTEADVTSVQDKLKKHDVAGLVGMFCFRNSQAVEAIKDAYRTKFDMTLEADIKELLDEDHSNLVLAVSKSGRPEQETCKEDEALADSQELHESGDGRWTSDNGKFIRLLSEKSFKQLGAISDAYTNVTGGAHIDDTVAAECDKSFAKAVEVLIYCLEDSAAYMAEQLHDLMAIKNKAPFINLLMQRSEIDIQAIRKAYKKKYDIDLLEDIKYFCKGDAVKLLLDAAHKMPQIRGPTSKGQRKDKKFKHVTVVTQPKQVPLRRPEQKKLLESNADNPLSQPTKRVLAESTPRKDNAAKKGKKLKPEGTIKAGKDYNLEQDAQRLKEAMSKYEDDDSLLINLLTTRSSEQRQSIQAKYKEKYKKEAIKSVTWEKFGDSEEAIKALLRSSSELDAWTIKQCQDNTRDPLLLGVLATRSCKQLKDIQAVYSINYDADLTDQLQGEGVNELLCGLLHSKTEPTTLIDSDLLNYDVSELTKKDTIDASSTVFHDIFTQRSRAQFRATLAEFEKNTGQSLAEALKKSNLGADEEVYVTLVNAREDPAAFYASTLHNVLVASSPSDWSLVSVIVSRSEVDLQNIKTRYQESYDTSLETAVTDTCQADYKKILLKVLCP